MAKFKPRQRKHKVIQRSQRPRAASEAQDPNSISLLPATKAQQIALASEARKALDDRQHSMPSQKQKRLEKYIASKLKKEENVELIKKLASARFDTSGLQSLRTLGGGKGPKQNVLSQAKVEHAAIPMGSGAVAVVRRNGSVSASSDDEDSEDSQASDNKKVSSPVNARAVKDLPAASLGTGLKRPLELDDQGNPVIQKRRRVSLRTRRSSFRDRTRRAESPSEEGPSNGEYSRQRDHSQEGGWHGIDSEGDESNNENLGDLSIGDSESALAESNGSTDTDTDPDSDAEEVNDPYKDPDLVEHRERRSEAFKAWIRDRLLDTNDESIMPAPWAPSVPHEPIIRRHVDNDDPLPPELQVTTSSINRKAFNVQVKRSPEFQEARLSLPVVAEEQKIMEAIHNNPIVIIWGATGSGKTTQVPQFLYEAGYGAPDSPTSGMIGITQPRRVAAVSSANRVREELGSASDKVSYQIRFDSTVSGRTAIKYMTDGILVREITEDVALSKYSVIIIDEAHERSTNTDILIGMLTRIVNLRSTYVHPGGEARPLKLVIMSATLRVSDFISNKLLFRDGQPPLVQAEGRQYPVTVHFARRTERDYVEETFKKVSKGHKQLPPGGMLVFLTGQSEINALAERLSEALFKPTTISRASIAQSAVSDMPPDIDDIEAGGDDFKDSNIDEQDISDTEDENEFVIEEDETEASEDVRILPLYSQLSTKAQLRVFEAPPENTRLIVLATNVAETSLTIPGIRYVFDCGRAKEKKYDTNTGVQTFEVGWISKASANQRAGRAGRTGPGHVYRLYSSAVYERDFEEHAVPEILRTPIEGVILQLKSMKLRNIASFPFPTPPDLGSLLKAEKLLTHLGSLTAEGNITAHGQDLAQYPLSPRFAKMLSIGHQADCIYLTIATAAALAIRDIFVPENQPILEPGSTPQAPSIRIPGYKFTSLSPTADFLKYLSAFAAYSWHLNSTSASPSLSDLEIFCTSLSLRAKPLKEVSHLYHQLLNVVSRTHQSLLPTTQNQSIHTAKIPTPSKRQIAALKQIVAAGFIDQIAIRADLAPSPPEMARKPRRAIDVPYFTLFPSHEGRAISLQEKAVFIHPSSLLATGPVDEMPAYLVYSHLQRSAPSTVEGGEVKKVRMHPLTEVKAGWISHLARGTPLVRYGKSISRIEGGRKVERAVPMLVGEKGATGWPLPEEGVDGRGKGKGN
ncbi:putative ATP-dependent RNA helicase DHR1 [Trapelia coarctata]|nr:putative ATP-dependent RNA helicase DHR1 [Trapelia coarctata]